MIKQNMRRTVLAGVILAGVILAGLVVFDFVNASDNPAHLKESRPVFAGNLASDKYFRPVADFGEPQYNNTVVAIVRSDDKDLAHPASINKADLSYATIEEMVRKACGLAGGLEGIVKPGDLVLIKPNIVDPKPPGSGEVTDVRVVKALVKIINEIAPGRIEIVIGEGSPRPMDYEMPYQSKFKYPQWTKLWDKSGYQDLLVDPGLKGINLRFSNLNGSPPENPWEDLVRVDVPGGGEALPQSGKYYIHKDVLAADAIITVPVMKIHEPGITCALKNQIGIAPSSRYGFSKTAGVPQDNYLTRLWHTSTVPKYWTDKEIVDLNLIARPAFVVVDALACLETQKTVIYSGGGIKNLVRMNTVIAGRDPVAIDHMASRLMGLNPDDIEHITLAQKRGLGTNDPARISIVGADLQATARRFKKNSTNYADFGQGNRVWRLSPPFAGDGIADPLSYQFIPSEAAATLLSDSKDFSEPIYFTDDRIDLAAYYGGNKKSACYALSWFFAPRDQEAVLWIGSDEGLKIYLNGQPVYEFKGARFFPDDALVNDKKRVTIKAGVNTLLVKAVQERGTFDFCLNICELEDNPDLDGNRVWGLQFLAHP